eukprot:5246_1
MGTTDSSSQIFGANMDLATAGYCRRHKVTIKPIIEIIIDYLWEIFEHKTDFDENGIIYHIGSNRGQRAFANPVNAGFIKISSSGWACPAGWGFGKIEDILERKKDLFYCCSDFYVAKPWFIIDFEANVKIKPTKYTLRHDKYLGNCLRNWQFSGSNDGKNWNVLKQHHNDNSLNKVFESDTWNVNGCNECYQMFRIYMTTRNNSKKWNLCCSGFEIYGYLIRFKYRIVFKNQAKKYK